MIRLENESGVNTPIHRYLINLVQCLDQDGACLENLPNLKLAKKVIRQFLDP